MPPYIYIYDMLYRIYYIFAGPLAQGVIEGSCSLSLFVIPPFIPPGTFGPRSRPAWAPSGTPPDPLEGPRSPGEPPRGPQGPSRDAPGTPRDLPRAPKDPLVSPQEAAGPPRSAPGRPRAPQVSFKTAPKLEIQQKPTFFQCFSKRPGDTQGPLRTPQGSPKDPPRRPRDS